MSELNIQELRDYVEIQKTLSDAVVRKYSYVNNWEFLIDFPRTGFVLVDGASWNFHKHGSGLRFSSQLDGTTVDITEQVRNWRMFGVWRLMDYFESKGLKRDESDVKEFLRNLESKKVIVAVQNSSYSYAFSES